MKIRILNNSIRFRLSKSDVKALAENDQVFAKTSFPLSTFQYGIVHNKEANITKASFNDQSIIVALSTDHLKLLTQTDHVGIDEVFVFEKDQLNIKVEKDLKCLEDRGEDESDLFDNPKESC